MSKLRFCRRWIAFTLLVPIAAAAHHSRTQYEGSEIQEIQGELVSVSWTNPHAAFSVRVTSASGATDTWRLESWGSPYVLSRMGVTKDQFVVGSQVRLAGRVSTLVPNRFLLTNMLRPDGTEVVLTTDGDAFWNSRQIGGRAQWQDDEISTAAEEDRGLFRVWSTARMGQARNNRIVLTEHALAVRKSFDQSKSFVVTCEPQGMPTVMNWVYPFEFSLSDRTRSSFAASISTSSERSTWRRRLCPQTWRRAGSDTRSGAGRMTAARWSSRRPESTGRTTTPSVRRSRPPSKIVERFALGDDSRPSRIGKRHRSGDVHGAGDSRVGAPRARGDHRAFRCAPDL